MVTTRTVSSRRLSGDSQDIIDASGRTAITRPTVGDRSESDFASALEQGFRSAGWKGAVTKGIEARKAQRKNGYRSAYGIAELYAELGDKDQALQWLNTAYQERDVNLLNLKTDFALDPIRSDPQFAELVRRVGLPQ